MFVLVEECLVASQQRVFVFEAASIIRIAIELDDTSLLAPGSHTAML